MQEIAEKHSKGSQLDEDAIWKEYAEERAKQKTQFEVSSSQLSPPYDGSKTEFRKPIFGRKTGQKSG